MSGNREIFSPKPFFEIRTLQFNFISDLLSSETINSATVEVDVFSGTDAAPEDILSGSDSTSGAVVSQKVVGGEPGVIYLLSCSVATSEGNTLVKQGLLAVL